MLSIYSIVPSLCSITYMPQLCFRGWIASADAYARCVRRSSRGRVAGRKIAEETWLEWLSIRGRSTLLQQPRWLRRKLAICGRRRQLLPAGLISQASQHASTPEGRGVMAHGSDRGSRPSGASALTTSKQRLGFGDRSRRRSRDPLLSGALAGSAQEGGRLSPRLKRRTRVSLVSRILMDDLCR